MTRLFIAVSILPKDFLPFSKISNGILLIRKSVRDFFGTEEFLRILVEHPLKQKDFAKDVQEILE